MLKTVTIIIMMTITKITTILTIMVTYDVSIMDLHSAAPGLILAISHACKKSKRLVMMMMMMTIT